MRGSDEIKTGRARRLRANSTKTELRLWGHLRARNLIGRRFVRQEPIGPYIVDFVCREQRLVIEVDGGQHATDTRDAVRDRWLAAHHYRVLRFWNNDVLGNTEGVLEMIAAALPAESPPPPPRRRGPPPPPPRGGGGGGRRPARTTAAPRPSPPPPPPPDTKAQPAAGHGQ